jgi:hypothetical protein
MNLIVRFLSKYHVVLLMLMSLSCSPDKEKLLPNDDSYFPLEVGNVWEFDVDRTTYSLGENPTTGHYTTRHTITDTFINPDRNTIFKIAFERKIESNNWRLDSVGIVWRSLDKAFVQENGQTIVKMRFPLSEGMAWNGNDYNASPEIMFGCKIKDKPARSGSVFYPYTTMIVRRDDSTLLSRNKHTELYASDIGLVGTEKVFVKYCNTPECIGKRIINSGYKEISVLKTFSTK